MVLYTFECSNSLGALEDPTSTCRDRSRNASATSRSTPPPKQTPSLPGLLRLPRGHRERRQDPAARLRPQRALPPHQQQEQRPHDLLPQKRGQNDLLRRTRIRGRGRPVLHPELDVQNAKIPLARLPRYRGPSPRHEAEIR